MTNVLIRGGETHNEKQHVKTEAEAGDASTNQRTPRIAGHHQQLEGQGRVLPWILQREQGPADTLISDIWPPEL